MDGPVTGRTEVLLVCGGQWHDFELARRELLGLLSGHERARAHVFADYRDLAALDTATALVTYTCNVRPDAAAQRALGDFVRRGGRWLALHATNAALDPPAPDGPRVFATPRVMGEVAQVLGSQFLGHPPIGPFQVEVTRPDHPLVEGLEAFEVRDELYVSELHPPIEVLLHTRFTGSCPTFAEGDAPDDEPRPVLYLKDTGAGTVCYLTLGHCRGRYDLQDLGVDDLGVVDRGPWDVPEFRTVLRRAVAWALGEG